MRSESARLRYRPINRERAVRFFSCGSLLGQVGNGDRETYLGGNQLALSGWRTHSGCSVR